jgi:predicted acyl esterase
MRYIEKLPHTTRQEDHVRIPMPDGVHLSARIWRPVSSDDSPVPAILEYIPYRKSDLSSVRDSIHHPYIAGHGYACVRVDLRGTGDSEGVLTDEYLEVEQSDAEAVLDWLTAQPWCDGTTGMMGISWGAFAALQVAARRPASLRAIVISSFTDDRYADDMHYMGGAMLSDNLAEAGTMFAYATCPPDPSAVGDRWRALWHERLEAAEPWVLNWLRHQRRDSYWRRASITPGKGPFGFPGSVHAVRSSPFCPTPPPATLVIGPPRPSTPAALNNPFSCCCFTGVPAARRPLRGRHRSARLR